MRDLDPLVVEHALLARLIADQERGAPADAAAYRALFPGHEELVERTLREFDAHARRTDDVLGAERFGPFEPLQVLGRGGQGVVYLARDTELPRTVALKVLAGVGALDATRQQRFRREAEVAARLDHPGLCRVLAFGVQGQVPYLAMQFVPGEPLADVLARGRGAGMVDLTTTGGGNGGRRRVDHVLLLLEKVARALHVAHAEGVVHRDVKPANIMLTPAGEPVVLDFGLARDDETAGATLTISNDVLGTPAYMAPEQIEGHARTDRRTDVFALGVVLYECLTGERPFQGATRQQLFLAIAHGGFRPASAVASGVPRDLDLVLAVALEKDPDRRYDTALALAEDLRRVREHQPVTARPIGPMVHLLRWVRRNRALAASLLVIALVTVAAGAATTTAWLRAEDARAESEAINEFILKDLLAAANPRGLGREARIVDALQHSVERIDVRLGGRPKLAATVRFELAKTYGGLGLWQESEQLLQATFAARAQLLGERDPATLAAEQALGAAQLRLARFAPAAATLERVLPALTAQSGPEAADTMTCRVDLCAARYGAGVQDESIAELQQLTARCVELFGERAEVTRAARTTLCDLLQRSNRIEEGLPLAQLLADTAAQQFGENALETIEARINLGLYLCSANRSQDAEQVLTPVVEQTRAVLGEAHPTYFAALCELGNCYSYQRRGADAARVFRLAFDGARDVLGAEHEVTLVYASNLAIALRRSGDLDAAMAVADDVLAARRRAFGADSEPVAASWDVLAAIHIDRQDWPAAITAANAAVRIIEALHGPDSPLLTDYLFNRAMAFQRSGDLTRAIDDFGRLAAIDALAFGADSPWRAQVLVRRGNLLYLQGRFDDAVEPLREGLRIRELEQPADVERLHEARAWVAMNDYRRGNRDGVEPVLTAAWDALDAIGRLRARFGNSDLFPVLAEIYEQQGANERLAKVRAVMAGGR
ncbi:MAG: serine/threonine protein kinase [Planctomycetes bacterium]|nr:serine/threonine protein kinase [Planctomycetota bacterium]